MKNEQTEWQWAQPISEFFHPQRMTGAGWQSGSVPTLVPKPGSPIVTQEHLAGCKSDAHRALGISWVMLDHEIGALKIRVSVVTAPFLTAHQRSIRKDPQHAYRQSGRIALSPIFCVNYNRAGHARPH